MIRTDHARAYGTLCMAGATLPLAIHLNFATWETVLVGFFFGLGAFLYRIRRHVFTQPGSKTDMDRRMSDVRSAPAGADIAANGRYAPKD